jgi:nucleoside-diphosphate-sugar epimerase
MLRNVLSGRAIMDDGGARYVNQVHRDDVAAALFLLAKAPLIAAPRLINVVDDRPMPQRECYEWLARRLGLDAPDYLPRPGGSRRGRTNKRVSNSKLHELGWRPAYPSFAEAMERSIIPSFLGTGPPVGDQTPV